LRVVDPLGDYATPISTTSATAPLARGGRHNPSQFLQHAISGGDLHEALRQAGVERISETRLIALEPSGKITVLKAQ
jgi:uncharacterized membrane protein YcaP (DUF421 family)